MATHTQSGLPIVPSDIVKEFFAKALENDNMGLDFAKLAIRIRDENKYLSCYIESVFHTVYGDNIPKDKLSFMIQSIYGLIMILEQSEEYYRKEGNVCSHTDADQNG